MIENKRLAYLDQSPAEEGLDVVVDGDGSTIHIAPMPNARYERHLETMHRRRWPEAVHEEAIAKYVLLGWRGLTTEGKPIAPTEENRLLMIRQYPRFKVLVINEAQNLGNLRDQPAQIRETMTRNKVEMKLEEGLVLAHRFLNAIGDQARQHGGIIDAHRRRGVIAGSLRRRRPIVHDVDIVFRDGAFVKDAVDQLREHPGNGIEVFSWGPKLAAITYCGVPFDLFFSTPETFNTLLMHRTGSKENNIRLCSVAKDRGWKLHASGEGLFNEKGERIAGDSERSIYDALGLPWQEPWERDVPSGEATPNVISA